MNIDTSHRNSQVMLLEEVHEDILYVIECIAENYTGEAKTELSGITATNHFGKLHASYQNHIITNVEKIITGLKNDNRDARTWLITLRRELRNTIAQLDGKKTIYNYAEVIQT